MRSFQALLFRNVAEGLAECTSDTVDDWVCISVDLHLVVLPLLALPLECSLLLPARLQ